MKVLSIDVGTKNLAVCVLDADPDEPEIEYWNVLETTGLKDLFEQLDVEVCLDESTHVVIEKQPSFNPKMRGVASALETYFIIRGQLDSTHVTRVVSFSPKHKITLCAARIPSPPVPKSKRYRMHKKIAIEECADRIKESSTLTGFYSGHKKKDDLADSYLQGIAYIQMNRCLR